MDILPLVFFIVCCITAGITSGGKNIHYDASVVDLTDGWVTLDGEAVSMNALPRGDVTVTHDLSNISTINKRLCFHSTHTHITASFDGETTYVYAPVQKPLFGKSYGMCIHMVPIPLDAKSVTLTLTPLYKNPALLRQVEIADPGMFLGDFYHDNLPGFLLCLLIVTFGVLMLILGITNMVAEGNNNINFFSLGTFAILAGLWTTNETLILQVFTQHPEMIRFMTYMCLVFIAYPPVSYIASATNQRNSKLLPILLVLVYLNFTSTILLAVTGICDIRDMLTFSHVNIAFAMFAVIYLMIRAKVKTTVDPGFLRVIVLSISPAVIGVGIDMIKFRFFYDRPYDTSLFTKLGMCMFIGFMGVHLVFEGMHGAVERAQAQIMKKMAYTDGLTELSNRAAFHKKEEEIRSGHLECVIVQLDINCLKRVNDVYGHAEGDRHIIGAAKMISDCFFELGTCYRTGGDEFIVVVQKGSTSDVERALIQMEKKVGEYNRTEAPPVPLQIAYGYAHCPKQTDALKKAEQEADRLMYSKKKEMKFSDGYASEGNTYPNLQ